MTEKVWKIRDKRTGLFVSKASLPWWYESYKRFGADRMAEHYKKIVADYEARPDFSPYATLAKTGRTYGRLSGAKKMLSTLANNIERSTANIFVITSPYFELVEYELTEVRVVDS